MYKRKETKNTDKFIVRNLPLVLRWPWMSERVLTSFIINL